MNTVHKAADVLFFLGAQASASGLTQVAHALGVPKPSMHRLLKSLSYRRLVEQDEQGRYRLGPGSVALGLGAGQDPVIFAARAPMEKYARQLGETFFLVVASAGELVVASQVEGSGFLRASPRVGSVVPTHATAVGRLFLALAPEQLHGTESPREVFTQSTPTTAAALDRRILDVRRKGYATSRDEWVDGLAAVAAPILVFGKMLGALAVACTSTQFDKLGEETLAHAVLSAAAEASADSQGESK